MDMLEIIASLNPNSPFGQAWQAYNEARAAIDVVIDQLHKALMEDTPLDMQRMEHLASHYREVHGEVTARMQEAHNAYHVMTNTSHDDEEDDGKIIAVELPGQYL